MVDGQTVLEFCNLEVEPMYHESDHIHITALTQLTGVPVQVGKHVNVDIKNLCIKTMLSRSRCLIMSCVKKLFKLNNWRKVNNPTLTHCYKTFYGRN